jgi:Transposase IS66 family
VHRPSRRQQVVNYGTRSIIYHVPLERIRAMMRSAGLELSAGTLCGVLEKLTPLFDPLYEAIQAQSRQAALCLMDSDAVGSLRRRT